MRVEITPSIEADLESLYPEALAHSCQAFSARENNVVIGVAGVYRTDGAVVAFSHVADRLRESPKGVVKLAKKMMTLVEQYDSVIAFADSKVESAHRTLHHLGFHFMGRTLHGDLFKWTR